MIFQKPIAVGTFVYKLLYNFNLAPWERLMTSPISTQISDMLDTVQKDMENSKQQRRQQQSNSLLPPYRGKALDLGCGRGLWSIELSKRNWNVTGIDVVESALQAANTNAKNAGVVPPTFIRGDMRKLTSIIGTTEDEKGYFDLILDFGGVHGLNPTDFPIVGKEITAISNPGAYLIVVAAKPGTQEWPQPRGMSMEEIRSTYYPDWDVLQNMEQEMETEEEVKGPCLGLYLLKKKRK